MADNKQTNIVLSDSFATHVDDVLQDSMFSRTNPPTQNESLPENINEMTTLNPLDVGLLEEATAATDDDDDHDQPHLSQQQAYSQTTRETLSNISDLIDKIVDHDNNNITTTTSKQTPVNKRSMMVSQGTMPQAPIKMVSTGTMPRTPIKTTSTGTMPKTPLIPSRTTTMPSSVSVAVTIQLDASDFTTTTTTSVPHSHEHEF